MKRYLFITWFIAAIVLAVDTTARAATQNDAQNKERAAALWEEAIRAKGGHERLQSIQNLLISSEIYTQSLKNDRTSNTETERLYVMPDKAWIYTSTPDLRTSLDATVINFQHRFCMTTLSPPFLLTPCIPDVPLEYLLEDPAIYLMETKWVRPQPLAARVEGKGRIDVIETKVGSLRVDFYLDRETRLPIKLVTDWSAVKQAMTKSGFTTVKLEDYENVDGIMMPRRVIREQQRTPDSEVSSRGSERARYRFNVAYNPTLFNSTVSPKVKRKDWMAAGS